MLKDCIEVFQKNLDTYGESLILDSYIPADGTYVIVKPIEDSFVIQDIVEIRLDKKTKILEGYTNSNISQIRFYDYNSKLIDMNKPIDPKKIIHSNNYLSFFIKKENLANGKLTQEIIDNYYTILIEPVSKYAKSSKSKMLYESVETQIGEVDIQRLTRIKQWIRDEIFQLDIDCTKKDYLKIFFVYPDEDYITEGERYLLPNIYNNNDFNQMINGKTLGVPNNNMGLNSKKPFLENKSRKISVPYMIDSEQILIQKQFFDYLMNFAAIGRVNIYFNFEDCTIEAYENGQLPNTTFKGAYMRISKGKELEIHSYDIIPEYNFNLKNEIRIINVLDMDNKFSKILYEPIRQRGQLQNIIDEVFFSKFLVFNYFSDAGKMRITDDTLKNNLLSSRDILFNWIYKGSNYGVEKTLDQISLSFVKGSIEKNYINKASEQFNLRWSLLMHFKGGFNMQVTINEIKEELKRKINEKETETIKSDQEYYFAIGQLIYYFLSKSKGKKKMHSLANPFINAKTNQLIKEKLRNFFVRYNYDIQLNGRRFNNLYGMISLYETKSPLVDQDMMIAGYLCNNLVYESTKEDVDDTKGEEL